MDTPHQTHYCANDEDAAFCAKKRSEQSSEAEMTMCDLCGTENVRLRPECPENERSRWLCHQCFYAIQAGWSEERPEEWPKEEPEPEERPRGRYKVRYL